MVITRRRFLKGLCCFAFFTVGKGVLPRTVFIPKCDRIASEIEANLYRSCFIGTGSIGRQIGLNLAQQYFDPTYAIDTYLNWEMGDRYNDQFDDYIIIFIAGKFDDPDFWHARKVAASASPHLIVSLVHGKKIDQNLLEDPMPGECQIHLSSKKQIQTAIDLMTTLCSPIKLPQLMGLDYQDIKSVLLGKRGVGFTIRSTFENCVPALARAVRTHKRLLQNSESIFAYFSCDYTIENYFSFYVLDNLLDLIHDNIPENVAIIYGTPLSRKIDTQFQSTIIVCSSHSSVWRI